MTIIVKKIKGAIRETLKFSCEDLKKGRVFNQRFLFWFKG